MDKTKIQIDDFVIFIYLICLRQPFWNCLRIGENERTTLSTEAVRIKILIRACKEKSEPAQKKLYQFFFSYAMSVALRYSTNRAEAEDILNEAFFKVFTKIDQYDDNYAFKKWFRRILINCSIDYYRKYKKLILPSLDEDHLLISNDNNKGWDHLLYEDILKNIQKLPNGYRLVFNLIAIEGCKHREVAEILNISIGTSKSNYSKAKAILQKYLLKEEKLNLYQNER